MALIETVRYVGVGVAVLGAVVTAPSGFGIVAAKGARVARSGREAVLRHIPWYHRHATAHPVTVTGQAGFGGVLVTAKASGWRWQPDAPLSDQIEDLRNRTEALSERLGESQASTTEAIGAVRQDLESAVSEQRAALAALRARLDQREQESAQLDAAGLPVIAVGIILLGLPDQAVRHWWVATPLFGITLVALIIAFKTRRVST